MSKAHNLSNLELQVDSDAVMKSAKNTHGKSLLQLKLVFGKC
jgi:hypothetical protein